MIPNSFITITPESIPVDEYVEFSADVLIKFEPDETVISPEPYLKVIHDIVFPDTIGDKVKWNKTGDMEFSVSGMFSDVFSRSIKYVNADNSKGEVTKFSSLPDTYGAVYSYTPTSESQMVVKYIIRMRDPNAIISSLKDDDFEQYTGVIVVRNNWQISNKFFQESIAKGGFSVQASQNGL
jgi:hypothetical protein